MPLFIFLLLLAQYLPLTNTLSPLLDLTSSFLSDNSPMSASLCCYDAVDLICGSEDDDHNAMAVDTIKTLSDRFTVPLQHVVATVDYVPAGATLVVLMDTGVTVMSMLEAQTVLAMSHNTWVFQDDNLFDPELISLNLESHLFSIRYGGMNVSEISEVYRISEWIPDTTVVNVIAEMDVEGMKMLESASMWERRKDLRGHMFKVCYKENFPYITIKDGKFGGLFYDLLQLLSETANFTAELSDSIDGDFGTENPTTGEWTGLIGMVVRNESDFSIADVSVTTARSKVVDFGVGIFTNVNKLFYRKPGVDYKWTTFVDVFDDMFWLAVLLACAFSFVLLAVFFRAYAVKKMGVLTAMGVVMAAYTGLDVEECPSKLPTRGLLLTVLLTGSLSFWCYNAGLVSQLSVVIVPYPIKSLEDILDQPDYYMVIEDGTAYLDYFRDAKFESNPIAYRMWNEKMKDEPRSLQKDITNMESLLLNDPFAVYFGPEVQTGLQMPRFPCMLVMADKPYFAVNIAFPFQKDSPYLRLFNHLISQLKERGHDQKLIQRILDQKTKLGCAISSGYRSIDYKDIFTAFLLLAAGAVVSAAVLAGESFSEWRARMNRAAIRRIPVFVKPLMR